MSNLQFKKLRQVQDLKAAVINPPPNYRELVAGSLPALKYDGLLLISYPNGSSKKETDLSQDLFWEFLQEYNLRPIAQVSVDETWSALRFRPADVVGK